MRKVTRIGSGLVAVILWAGTAQATGIGSGMTIRWNVQNEAANEQSRRLGGGEITSEQMGCDVSEEFTCGNSHDPTAAYWTESSEDFEFVLNGIWGDPDPILGVAFAVTNNTAAPLTFTMLSTMNVPSLSSPIEYAGSTGVTITDTSDPLDAVTLSTADPSPFYQGLIDGVAVAGATIFDHDYTLDCSSVTILPCTITDSGSLGPTQLAQGVASDIGLLHEFTLSPGDRAAVTAAFVVVESVPEPSIAMLMVGGLALFLTRGRPRRPRC